MLPVRQLPRPIVFVGMGSTWELKVNSWKASVSVTSWTAERATAGVAARGAKESRRDSPRRSGTALRPGASLPRRPRSGPHSAP